MATGDDDLKVSLAWSLATVFFTAISFALGYAVNGYGGLYAPSLSHGIQWVCCVLHAFPCQTEMYYDLTGSLTYMSIAIFTLVYTIAPQESTYCCMVPF